MRRPRSLAKLTKVNATRQLPRNRFHIKKNVAELQTLEL